MGQEDTKDTKDTAKVDQVEETEVLEVQELEVPEQEEREQKVSGPVQTVTKQRSSKKMLVSAFVLGIVGTSLAVLALVTSIVGFAGGRGDFGHRGHGPHAVEEGYVTEEVEIQMERPGHGGSRDREDFDWEDFELRERFDGRNDSQMERFDLPRGIDPDAPEELELSGEVLEELIRQNS